MRSRRRLRLPCSACRRAPAPAGAAGPTPRLLARPAAHALRPRRRPPRAQMAPPPTSGGSASGSRSPLGSPLVRGTSVPGPFSRRVAVAYDASAVGEYLLQWIQQHITNRDDAIYVVRACARAPGRRGAC